MDKVYAVIGAGPCGLAMMRSLLKAGIKAQGFEYHSDVGGIWNQDNPLSTVYNSAHLISSRPMTEFKEFPIQTTAADFPHQRKLREYFLDYASHFDLRENIRFNSEIINVDEKDGLWNIEYRDTKSGNNFTEGFAGVILATGLFNKGNENYPKWKGMETFPGKIMHASAYKSNEEFANKRVLIVGCGNSAADIAIDAVHRASQVHMSVRRGYYFVPKYIFGKPMDQVNGKIGKLLPDRIKKKVDKKVLQMFTGDPVKFGFPKPDYDFLESHPVINSYLLQHIGHGDIEVQRDIDFIDGSTVVFKDKTREEYDLILTATGYHIKFKYISKDDLNWNGACPDLHLNIFSPKYDNLFMMGMIEATGIGWEGRFKQSELISAYIKMKDSKSNSLEFKRFESERIANDTSLTNGMKYIKLDRMSYYVHKDFYMNLINTKTRQLL